jgi:DnaJ-class molecular chaperone
MVKKKTASVEVKCEACNGTGLTTVIQPERPGRRIYPPPCTVCGGKGRIRNQED